MSKCMMPRCDSTKRETDVFCRAHWERVPRELREEFWATEPYSDERRGMLLKVVRWAFDNKVAMSGLRLAPAASDDS